jgi:hypothetical protein
MNRQFELRYGEANVTALEYPFENLCLFPDVYKTIPGVSSHDASNFKNRIASYFGSIKSQVGWMAVNVTL